MEFILYKIISWCHQHFMAGFDLHLSVFPTSYFIYAALARNLCNFAIVL